MHSLAWRRVVILACLSVAVSASEGRAQPLPTSNLDAIRGVVAAFERYPVVAIGENHGLRQAGDFYVALVKSPELAAKVDDIVIEFGSQRSQPIVDRYIAGEPVPLKELSQVWQNTTKTLSWESPIYPALLAAVRDVNQRTPAKRRLRVVAGDAPIDWDNVHTHAEWAAFQPNDVAFADVIGREVLARKRKALVILGSDHLTKGGNRNGGPNTTTRINDKFLGSMFVVLLHTRGPRDDEAQMASWHAPALAPVAGTWLASRPRGGRRLGELCDALLYLGPAARLTTAQPDWDRLDRDYLQEVDRRCRIQFGCPFELDRWKRGLRPCP
jgi:hypothetical protein